MAPAELLAASRQAIVHGVERLAEIIPSGEMARAIQGSRWTVGDAVAHLVTAFDLYSELAAGTGSPYSALDPASCADENAKRLADVSERDAARLASLLLGAADRFATATAGRSGDQEVVWHGGVRVDLASLAGILLGEVLLHGYDVATALDRAWRLSTADAALVLAAYGPVSELDVDHERSAGLTASFDLNLGVAGRYIVRFENGCFTIGPWSEQPVDCTLAADPSAYLLVVSGRLDRWMAVALGLFNAGGSRPELALGLTELLLVY